MTVLFLPDCEKLSVMKNISNSEEQVDIILCEILLLLESNSRLTCPPFCSASIPQLYQLGDGN